MAWPVEVVAEGHYELNTGAIRIEWVFCFEWNRFDVLATKAVSPLHKWLAKQKENVSVAFVKDGRSRGVLDWQIAHGFPGISEAALRAVYVTEKLDMLDPTQSSDLKSEMRGDLTSKLRPDSSQSDAAEAIQEGREHGLLDGAACRSGHAARCGQHQRPW